MVTQRVGALNDRFLSRGRPLAMARLLWEIGEEGGEIVMLRSRLGLDSGQLSRMLRALEAEGLVSVTPSEVDGRIRVVRLTRKGLDERAVLDARSEDLAASMLDPLSPPERAELVSAMRAVERLITRSLVELREVDPASADAQRCLRAYAAELRRRAPDRGFDPSKGATAHPHEVRPPNGAFVVAYLHGEAIGCGAVKHQSGDVSDIKRMWVAESARGLGLGRRLLERLEGLARARGSTEAHIETADVLPEAIALYRSAGYVEVPPFNDEPFADRWLAKRLRATGPISVTRRGDGPEILLVHGGASPETTWSALAPLCARWTLASVRRRGYPPSPPPEGGRQDFEADAADLVALLDSRPHVVAHSYGVLGTLIAAAQRPEDVRSLTLIEPPLYRVVHDDPEVEALERIGDAVLIDGLDADPQTLREFLRVAGAPGVDDGPLPGAVASGVRRAHGGRLPGEARPDLDRIREAAVPTLVASGGHAPGLERICDALATILDADRLVAPGAGHFVAAAPGFADRLDEFLASAA